MSTTEYDELADKWEHDPQAALAHIKDCVAGAKNEVEKRLGITRTDEGEGIVNNGR